MADLRFDNKNNQKKSGSVFASGLIEKTAAESVDDILFTLPKDSLVTAAYVVVDVAGGANDELELLVNSTSVSDTLAIGAIGTVVGDTTPTFFATGGEVTITGTVSSACSYRLVVEYIETELSDGTYTD